jgi:hypothetical protein
MFESPQKYPTVILSAVFVSRSEANTESKDPYDHYGSMKASRGASTPSPFSMRKFLLSTAKIPALPQTTREGRGTLGLLYPENCGKIPEKFRPPRSIRSRSV